MKLRNKKTGEIVYATMMASYGGGELQIRYYPIDRAEDTHFKEYRSIAELNEEWQDYEEEEKEYYTLNSSGQIWTTECFNEESIKNMKSIGNYFETEEEAEKAVEKLKAWKRLKDKGFKFIGKTYETDKRFGSIFYKLNEDTYSEDVVDVLALLFGGEE